MDIIEVVPNTTNALHKIKFYNKKSDPWLYVYRRDVATAYKMLKEARNMLESGTIFIYENPSFGWRPWCCVTFVSYLATIATNNYWKMGSNANNYIWSPRYGYGYDQALLNMGFKKYNYNDVELKTGDIVQSWTHAAIVEKESEKMTTEQRYILDAVENTTLKRGMKEPEHLIKMVQAWLTYYKWYIGKIDGDFGQMTEAAVKSWQNWEGREATGRIEYVDWKIIEEVYS